MQDKGGMHSISVMSEWEYGQCWFLGVSGASSFFLGGEDCLLSLLQNAC